MVLGLERWSGNLKLQEKNDSKQLLKTKVEGTNSGDKMYKTELK